MDLWQKYRKSELVVMACAAGTLAIGFLVLTGWVFGISLLKTVVPGYITMKANTAVGLASFGIAIVGLYISDRHKMAWGKLVAGAFLGLGFSIGFGTILQYMFDLDFGIDQLLFMDPDRIGAGYPPGRLAPVTATSLTLIPVAVYLAHFKKKPFIRTSQILLFVVGLISFQANVSTLLGVGTTFGVAHYTKMALHTAFAMVMVAVGFLCLKPNRGFMRALFFDSYSGLLARRMIFAAIFVPPFVAFLTAVGLQARLFSADFETLIRVVGSVTFFVVMVIMTTERLHVEEEKARQALEALVVKDKEGIRLLAEKKAADRTIKSEALLTAALMEARTRAEKASEAKAMFLANMSHEIRTPLNGVIGISQILAASQLEPKQRELVETLQTSGNILLTLINDILDFSKIEARRMELEKTDFSLREVLKNQFDITQAKLVDKNLSLEIRIDDSIPAKIHGDGARVGQVLLNLLTNAVKFTHEGSIRVRAERQWTNYGKLPETIRISVTDTGIGMSLEVQQKLFQPFTQADGSTSRKYGGTGLGLSICHSLANLMGGRVGVNSEEGHGSTFWFEFPMERAQVEESEVVHPQEEESDEFQPFTDFGRTIRVLVAEDNMINQVVVTTHLNAIGIECQAVANGHEVLSALKIGQFDLILMDCQMPEMDGFQATRKIRENEAISKTRIPIIALTANAMKEDRDRCMDAGMDAYLTKPFERKALESMMRAQLKAA